MKALNFGEDAFTFQDGPAWGGSPLVQQSNNAWTNSLSSGSFNSAGAFQTSSPSKAPEVSFFTPSPMTTAIQSYSATPKTTKESGGFAGTILATPDTSASSDAWSGYTAPTPTATATATATATPATTVTAPAATAAGSNFTNYINSNSDLLGYWNSNQGKPGAFSYWGLDTPTMEEFGQAQWQKNGFGEYRTVTPDTPTAPTPTPTPTAPTVSNADKANALVDRIKGLYEGVSGLGNGANLNEIKLKQTERDNLLRELEGLGVANALATGKTYGGFIDTKYNDIATNQQAASKYFTDFLANFGGDAWAQAKNLGLGTNFNLLIDRLDAADDGFEKYGWDEARLSEAKAARDRLLSTLNERLTNQRDVKLRDSQWETGINSRLDQLVADLEGMDLAGFDANNATYRQKLRELENELRGYSSELPVNINDEIGKLSGASSLFSGLQSNLSAEIKQIRDNQAKYAIQGDTLMSALRGASAYDGSSIEALAEQVRALKSGVERMNSPLAQKYGDPELSKSFTGLDSIITALRGQNQTLTAQQQADLEELLARAGSIEDWDEDSMNNLASLLSGAGQSVGRFTGASVNQLRSIIDKANKTLQQKRGALTSKRSEIERTLQGLLNQLRDSKYATLDEVKAARGSLSPYMSDLTKYRATQAQDELDALMQIFAGEEGRINTDLKTAKARDEAQAAATRASTNRWGNLVGSYAGSDMLSPEAAATIARKRQVAAGLAPYATPVYSSFSVALGL